uniref:Bifunctional peptidase and (3S)-lysyl hydroxylase JMJD7 n=1 Tax=Ciona savignyi TaxID=51511 RepID=H2Z173_CIOSA
KMFQKVNEVLSECASEARELYLRGSVETHDGAPTALEFHRKWVARNVPCVFRNIIDHWPALHRWNEAYLARRMGEKLIDVAVTPDGFADAVRDGKFMLPEERSMTFSTFLRHLSEKDGSDVFYIQKQNSNLTSDFAEIKDDVDPDFAWATEAFGCKPDAVNFWMGGERAVTSLHKDHYENLYCVVKGKKTFTLIPPSDRPFLPYNSYPCYQHYHHDGWKIKRIAEPPTVPWISIDPLNPDLQQHPAYQQARPITCTVRAGEVLYLPSLWYHHVQQTDGTIAVNYWHDMDFDIKYAYFQTLDKLTSLLSEKRTKNWK